MQVDSQLGLISKAHCSSVGRGTVLLFMALLTALPWSLVKARRLINTGWSRSGKCYVLCV